MKEDDWEQKLTPDQFRVLRQNGTEPAFSGKYWDHHDDGTYTCAGCQTPLFSSATKFESGSGWPSFYESLDKDKVKLVDDNSLGMHRIEVQCKTCGGHLGHVFEDGPKPTGQRFCINSAALEFEKTAKEDK